MTPQQFKSERAVMVMCLLRIMTDTFMQSNYEGFSEYLRNNGSYPGVKQKIPAQYIKDMIEFKIPFDVSVLIEAIDSVGKNWSNYQSFRDSMFSNFQGYPF